ncbi:MAG TPA: TOMM precursor leader peptide-binding protein [Longimicrobiaceae bacterium]|nr:TOMM precursor leader peptide-binding protein [Longimicrobiaceae bacterium]
MQQTQGDTIPANGQAVGAPGRYLRLRPGVTVIPDGPEESGPVWLRINSRVLRLRGGGARRILELIDGTRTLEDICRAAGAPGSPEIADVVDRFRRYGLLEPDPEGREDGSPVAPSAGWAPLLRALMDLGVEPGRAAAELREGRVAVLGRGRVADAVRTALEGYGVAHVHMWPLESVGSEALERAVAEADVAVAAPDTEDPELIERFNALALRWGLPWLAVRIDGFDLRLGPFVVPGETACYACYARRLDANSATFDSQAAVRDAARRGGVRMAPADNVIPGVTLLAAELCAFEVARFFASRVSTVAPTLYDHFADYSLTSHRAIPHRVLKLPRCSACGAKPLERSTVRAWVEPDGDGPPTPGTGGGWPPDPAVYDPLVGIVRACSELPHDVGAPGLFCFVSEATHSARFGNGTPECARYGCGVALTRERAAGAAMGEAIERYCAAMYDPALLQRASFGELEEEAVPPEAFALFSSGQYAEFAAGVGRDRAGLPRPFGRDARTTWVHGFSLTRSRAVLVPAPLVYLPYRYAADETWLSDGASTGLACSRRRDEATLRALCEVVERDAMAIVWHNFLALPRIALDPADALGVFHRERLALPGARCVLVSATLDVPIPTVLAALLDEEGGTFIGTATRPDPMEAVQKAILEATQARVTCRWEEAAGSGRRYADDFRDVVEFSDHARIYTHPEMRPHAEFLWSSDREVSLEDVPWLASGDVSRDLGSCVEMLRAVGLEVIAVDITSEDVRSAGYRVVRVVVPGMQSLAARHDSPRLGGRRLREVPVRMGLRARPLEEEEMNRSVHPFP